MIISIPLISIDRMIEIKDIKANIQLKERKLRIKGTFYDSSKPAVPFDFVVYSYKCKISKVSTLVCNIDAEDYLKKINLKMDILYNFISKKYTLTLNANQFSINNASLDELMKDFINYIK